jgi:hypothetical protein
LNFPCIQKTNTKPKMNTPRAEIKIATKQIVEWLLSMNVENRRLRESVVRVYLDEIKAGRWCLTNQGFGVSEEGILIDGQHRLHAMRRAGYPPLPILIVTGLSRESRLAVDQHAKRNARDLLQFAFNAKVTRSAPAIGRLIDKEKNANWGGGGTAIGKIMEMICEYREEIEAITEAPGLASFFSAPILTAAVMKARECGKIDEIITFLTRVMRGEMLHKNQPEYHLRNLVLGGQNGGAAYQREFLRKACKAIEYHLGGRPMGVLRAD